ncbi:hypothetical protein MMC25_002170 [Agyrium rufum]|nr:hypothetical protein [Agyrium rufum]
MSPGIRIPPTPGLPLFPVSPERVNRQFVPQSPCSPSTILNLHDDPFVHGHGRTASDVQNKVAQFNNLTKEVTQRRKDNDAALRRAVVGREEAESETRRLKEENTLLKQEIEEGRTRERRVGERLETVMEEMQRSKETHAHATALYEKDNRRYRKEAFKQSQKVISMQEELKTTRNRATLMREDVEAQKRGLEERDKEVFAAQYQLVGVQQELDHLKEQIKLVEQERDALRTSLKEEEVARIAAEGKIPLPVSAILDEFSSPKKEKDTERRESFKENVDQRVVEISEEDEDELEEQNEQLDNLRRGMAYYQRAVGSLRKDIHFMNMACQFKSCPCRLAEQRGENYVCDDRFNQQIKERVDRWNTMYEEVKAEKAAAQESMTDSEDQATPRPARSAPKRSASDEDNLSMPRPAKRGTSEAILQETISIAQEIPLPLEDEAEAELLISFSPVKPFNQAFTASLDTPNLSNADPMDASFRSSPSDPLSPAQILHIHQPSLHLIPLSESPSLLSLGPDTINTSMIDATESPHIPPISPSRNLIDFSTPTTPAALTFTHDRPETPPQPTNEIRTDAEPLDQTTSHSQIPETPKTNLIKSTTTTTRIPLASSRPSTPSSATTTRGRDLKSYTFSPATMSREEALEAIKMRRGRARSVVLTPSAAKSMRGKEGTPGRVGSGSPVKQRRDLSAPTKRPKTPVR